MKTVAELRREIDRADDAIVAALNARFALSDEMRELKKKIREEGGECPAVDPVREREIIAKVLAAVPPAHRDTVFSIYERIFGGSRGMVETIARGVAINDGKVLLCRAKGGKSTYLPGGHIEFGETGAEALVREVKEELGVDSSAGKLLGVVENSFVQHGRPHSEINLVYELSIDQTDATSAPESCEDWIEFEWRDLYDINKAELLPAEMKRLIFERNLKTRI